MTGAEYADDLALLDNTSAQTKCLLHSLKQAVESIHLYETAKRKKNVFLTRKATSTLSGRPLKLVNPLTYFGSNISSTESDVRIHLTDYQSYGNLIYLIK